MKKITRNKGFTLVELLAVLVVLAILAVITIPVVTKVINKTKTSSYELSVSAYGKAAENGLMAWAVEHQTGTYQVVDTWDDFNSVYGSFIETKGEEVTCQEAKVTKEGKLSLYYCSTKDSAKENKYYSYIKGKVKNVDSLSSTTEYSVGTEIRYKDIDWYVIKPSDERDDTVRLLKKTALTGTEIDIYGNGYLTRASQGGTMSYYESDTCNSSDQSGCTTDYAFSLVKIVLDAWGNDNLDNNDLVEDELGYKIRLITKGEYEKINNTQNSWRSTVNCWTMTQSVENSVYRIYASSGFISSSFVYFYQADFNGGNKVRPVINLSKSAQFKKID